MLLRNRENLHTPFVILASSSIQPLVVLSKTWANFTNEDIKILRDKIEIKAKLKEKVSYLAAFIHCRL
jgi:hypothetical protein